MKSWNPGDILTAADLNAEFNNPINNPITLISPTTGAINFQTSVAHTNLQVSALTASSGFAGSVLVASTAGTPAPLWSTGATAGGVFVATTASVPTWSTASQTGGVFIATTAGVPTWLGIGTSGQVVTAGTSGGTLWAGIRSQFSLPLHTGSTTIASGSTTFIGAAYASTVEPDVEHRLPVACTAVVAEFSASTTPGSAAGGATYAYTLRKNGADTAISGTISSTNVFTRYGPAGVAGVVFAQDDTVCVKVVTAATAATAFHRSLILFEQASPSTH